MTEDNLIHYRFEIFVISESGKAFPVEKFEAFLSFPVRNGMMIRVEDFVDDDILEKIEAHLSNPINQTHPPRVSDIIIAKERGREIVLAKLTYFFT